MANWMNKINLKPLMDKYKNDELTISELGCKIAELLKKVKLLPIIFRSDLKKIAVQFEDVNSEDEFDDILNQLYDLGDTEVGPRQGIIAQKLAWINTVFD